MLKKLQKIFGLGPNQSTPATIEGPRLIGQGPPRDQNGNFLPIKHVSAVDRQPILMTPIEPQSGAIHGISGDGDFGDIDEADWDGSYHTSIDPVTGKKSYDVSLIHRNVAARNAARHDVSVKEVHGKFKPQKEMTEPELQSKLEQLIRECNKR